MPLVTVLCLSLLLNTHSLAQTTVPATTPPTQTQIVTPDPAAPVVPPDTVTSMAPTSPVTTTPPVTAPAPTTTDSASTEENPFGITAGDLFGSIPALFGMIFTNPWVLWALLAASIVGNVILFTDLRKLRDIVAIERALKENSQRQLEFQAMYDALTQLPNRRLFQDRLLETFKLCSRSRTRFGVMATDLDHFKEINDTMGHDAGDELLEQVSKRLRAVMRESDTLARMGGDEFAIICPSVNDFKTASVVCLRIIQALQEPIIIKGKVAPVGISIGVALFPDHGTDTEILLRRADVAMYRAKQKRNAYALYDPNVDRAV